MSSRDPLIPWSGTGSWVTGHAGHGSAEWWVAWVTGHKLWPIDSSAVDGNDRYDHCPPVLTAEL